MGEREINLSMASTKPASPEMADHLSRRFRAQITAAMDAILRSAALGLAEIFDRCVHDYCMQLAEKGEAIARLEMKLRNTERLLKEYVGECDKVAARNETEGDERRGEGEDILITSCTASPERRFQVPVACISETVTKDYGDICPGIRLRQISIPLQHCPVMPSPEPESRRRSKGGTKKASSPSESQKAPQRPSMTKRGLRCRLPARNNMKGLLQDAKEENLDRPVTAAARRRSERKRQRRRPADKTRRQKATTEQVKSDEKMSFCKLCDKVFDTPLAQNVHRRLHKKCRGCKKDFSLPSARKNHQQLCPTLKKSSEAAPSAPLPQPHLELRDKNRRTKQVKAEEKSTPSPDPDIQSFSCMRRHEKFIEMSTLEDHKSVHRDQKQFQCCLCSKRFCYKKALETHIVKWHQNFIRPEEDFKWMEPIEDPEDLERILPCHKCPMTFCTCIQLHKDTKTKHPPQK
uniref:uncharacterized protein LOC131110424 n=1 Tax=Doryrhamphus excisus TaxID=161450 RepID=UPI0025AE07E4|nr:uncharacterized protein LOC131110424 [Doryrhamphus excisus]